MSFVSTAGQQRLQGDFWDAFDTTRARHSHSLSWLPRSFPCTYLHLVVKSHQASFELPSFPPMGSFHQALLSPAQQVNQQGGERGAGGSRGYKGAFQQSWNKKLQCPQCALLLKRAFVSIGKGRSFFFTLHRFVRLEQAWCQQHWQKCFMSVIFTAGKMWPNWTVVPSPH